MNYDFDPVSIGIRMKQARQAKGWSQEVLAEKANYTAQYISKLEKNGISDITLIASLSKILDIDLLEATLDAVGTVNEIGKEILIRLVSAGGFIETNDVLNHLYGLSDKEITAEIVKLDKIGLIVRELYTDWIGDDKDRIFITAKGLVTLKNMELNSRSSEIVYEKVDDVETYESIRNGASSYQEVIDSNEKEKLARNIYKDYIKLDRMMTAFPVHRVNFVKYVINKIENKRDRDYQMDEFLDKKGCTAVNCYHDILYRMALRISNEMLAQYLNEWDFDIYDDYDWLEHFAEKYCGADKAKDVAVKAFISEFEIEDEDISDYSFRSISEKYSYLKEKIYKELNIDKKKSCSDVLTDYYAGKIELTEKQLDLIDDLRDTEDSLDNRFEQSDLDLPEEVIGSFVPQNSNSVIPCDWFSKEEIEQFINENFGAAKTDIDRGIDETLNKIIALEPSLLDYYKFPKEWEENGLADLVRKNVGLNKS